MHATISCVWLGSVFTLSTQSPCRAQDLPEEIKQAMHTIDGQTIVEHARILSEARYQGREAGSTGVRHSAGYIGVDIVLDQGLGPMVLEANARPGLAIQIANRRGLLPLIHQVDQDRSAVC